MKINKTMLLMLLLLWTAACNTETYQAGERLYKSFCANCHMDAGEGLGELIPPLAGSDYLNLHRDKLPCIIRHGLTDTISVNGKTYTEQMAGHPGLSEIQIANLLNYVTHSWGNDQKAYSYEEVTELLKHCQ